MSSEIDEQCAQALGWVRGTHTRADGSTYPCHYWHDAKGCRSERVDDDRCMECHRDDPAWSPSTDLADVRQLEDEIERRGLQEAYIQALDSFVTYERSEGWQWFRWGILRATPEQRARAFLKAIGG